MDRKIRINFWRVLISQEMLRNSRKINLPNRFIRCESGRLSI
jgi:hypothetical protein